MNILHISPYFPDIDENHAGGVCMGKSIETLKKQHKVYVLTFVASELDRQIAQKYKNDFYYKTVPINKGTRLFHVLLNPFLPNFFAARSSFRFAFHLIQMIRRHQIEAIHVEYASMGQYIWLIRRFFPLLRVYMVEHDVTAQSYERKVMQSKGIKRLYYKWQHTRIVATEGKYCRSATAILVFNEKDRELISRYYKVSEVKVLNPYYGIESQRMQCAEKITHHDASICFLGQMGRRENYEAAGRLIRISQKIKIHIPELQVYIVGNGPPKELKKLQNEYIHITGFVEDVDQYLLSSQLAVFPLTLGAGIKLKVLRSLALGIPVVTGKVGAEGIDEAGDVITLAETDIEYEEAVKSLLGNQKRRCELSRRSREYVNEKFGWDKSEVILYDMYKA